MPGSFESVRWNVHVHRLDLGLYSHPKEFGENGVRTYVNSKVKIPLRGGSNPQRRELNTLPTTLFFLLSRSVQPLTLTKPAERQGEHSGRPAAKRDAAPKQILCHLHSVQRTLGEPVRHSGTSTCSPILLLWWVRGYGSVGRGRITHE